MWFSIGCLRLVSAWSSAAPFTLSGVTMYSWLLGVIATEIILVSLRES